MRLSMRGPTYDLVARGGRHWTTTPCQERLEGHASKYQTLYQETSFMPVMNMGIKGIDCNSQLKLLIIDIMGV